jgi:hypothetical protein
MRGFSWALTIGGGLVAVAGLTDGKTAVIGALFFILGVLADDFLTSW